MTRFVVVIIIIMIPDLYLRNDAMGIMGRRERDRPSPPQAKLAVVIVSDRDRVAAVVWRERVSRRRRRLWVSSFLPLVSTEPNDFKIDYGAGEGGRGGESRRDDGRFAPDDDDGGGEGGGDDEIRKFRALIGGPPPLVWRSYFPASHVFPHSSPSEWAS